MDNKLESLESVAVYEVVGEPAIVINGVPSLPTESAEPVQLCTVDNTGGDSGSLFGDWPEGREIRKMFGELYYSGKVDKYDDDEKWYRVTYEDGDFEDLEWRELEEVLVPLDISVPLTAVALRQYTVDGDSPQTKSKIVEHVSQTKTSSGRKRGRPKNSRNKEKTRDLLQTFETDIMVAQTSQESMLNAEQNLLGKTIHAKSGDNISKSAKPDICESVESVKMTELVSMPCEAELTGNVAMQVIVSEEVVEEDFIGQT